MFNESNKTYIFSLSGEAASRSINGDVSRSARSTPRGTPVGGGVYGSVGSRPSLLAAGAPSLHGSRSSLTGRVHSSHPASQHRVYIPQVCWGINSFHRQKTTTAINQNTS